MENNEKYEDYRATSINSDQRISNKSINSANNNINNISKRIFILSPSVKEGLDRECTKNDFNREDNNSIDLGCFGKVWRVSHKRTAKLYAIKILHKEKVIKKKLQGEINSTLEKMYQAHHVNLLRLHSHFEDDENLYLVISQNFKFTLLDELKRCEFDENRALRYATQLIHAIIYLSSINIYNRDLKSENILIDENGIVKITDYSWSDISDNKYDSSRRKSFISETGRSINAYTAPEVIANDTITTKIDVWHLGVLLFEMFSKGDLPFKGSSLEELKSNILNVKISWGNFPSEMGKNIIKSMLKRDPNERVCLHDIIKNVLSLQVQISGYNPEEKIDREKSIINNKSSHGRQDSKGSINYSNYTPQDQFIFKLKKENEILKNEIESWKSKCFQLEKDYNKLKDNATLNSGDSSPPYNGESGQEDSFMYLEDKMKFEYVNKDRMSKVTELEEKAQEILEYRSRIRMLENEIELLNLNFDEVKESNAEYEKEIKKLNNTLEEERNEKDSKISLLNNKLEMLENKLFNPRFTYPGTSSGSNPLPSTEEFCKKFSILLYDLVKEFKESVQKLLMRSKDENDTLLKTLTDTISSKEDLIKEILNKTKEGIECEFIKKGQKTNLETAKSCSLNDKMEWLKKQINELIPYKLKSMNLEESMIKLEKEIKLINEKLTLMDIEKNILSSTLKEKCITEDNLKKYITNIENKLSDVKDFILKNCPNHIEDFFIIYKI